MNFRKKKLHDHIQILINNSIVKEVETTKFLGMWIDSNQTCKSNIQHLTEKLS